MESAQSALIDQSFNGQYSLWIRESLDVLPDNFTITDPSISGHPIVFASRGFLKMTGYSKEEVIGKNGRMFQGPRTNRRSVMEIREAIREERAVQVKLLNYRKDGTPFWMVFQMCPVFSKEDGRVIHFIGVQVPILKKQRTRSLNSGFGRNGVGLCEEDNSMIMREIVFGSCRREVFSDSLLEVGRVLDRDLVLDSDNRGIEETCEASECEKQRAAIAINNVFSVLIQHSEMKGKPVCGQRCSLRGAGCFLSSSLNISLGRIKQSFVLTDPHLPDFPIVYASDAFLKLTGYTRHEVLGRNCRFLSGADTDFSTLFQIKESIRTEQPCTVRILNYRKDKSLFWNILHIAPVRNASGKIAYFVGIQIDEDCENQDGHGLCPKIRHLSVVGAVKVAVRSLSMGTGPSEDKL